MPNSVIAKWSFYVSYDGEWSFFPSHCSQWAHNFNQLSIQKIKKISLSLSLSPPPAFSLISELFTV